MKDLIIDNSDALLLGLKHGLVIGFGAFAVVMTLFLAIEAFIRWRNK